MGSKRVNKVVVPTLVAALGLAGCCDTRYRTDSVTYDAGDNPLADVGDPDDPLVVSDTPPVDAPDDAEVGEDTGAEVGEDTSDSGTDPRDDPATGPLCDLVTVGDEIIVIDWPCPVAEICEAGSVLVDCALGGVPGSDWYCFCTGEREWDYDCVEWAPAGEGVCPDRPSKEGAPCAYGLGFEACDAGLFCRQDESSGFGIRGTCVALEELCHERSCYRDRECPTDADVELGCYGALPLDGEQGVCRMVPGDPPACMGVEDCPLGWSCEAATLTCETGCECGEPAGDDEEGICRQISGSSAPALWLPDRVGYFRVGEPIMPYWTKGDIGDTSDWISCPAYSVEMRTLDGWRVVSEEPCTESERGRPIELPPGTIRPLKPVFLTLPDGQSEAVFRLEGRYYNGCDGVMDVEGCQGGPYQRFSSRSYQLY